MKKYLLIATFLMTVDVAFAQTGKKAASDKPPSKKEMADMMKEMQQAMNEISPEDKRMMDSMGIKLPDTKSIQKNMSGVSDAQLKKAYDDGERVIPVKDVARIRAAMSVTIATAGMAAYVDKLHGFVVDKMPADVKTEAERLYRQSRSQNYDIGKTAVFLWIYGKPLHSLYLAGMACKNSNADVDCLNNYAAFLSMAGAEEIALPILENLNKRFPKNSTILNNICQAWFGLGDVERAGKYADSVLRIFAYHPQANYTRCLIEESKGNTTAAVEAAKKSIRKGYSPEKQRKLEKLGYKLKPVDIDWDRPIPKDAMGLTKFTWPEYPRDVEKTAVLEMEWQAYRENCDAELQELEIERERLEKEVETNNQQRMQEMMLNGQQGKIVSIVPLSEAKAIVKFRPSIEQFEANTSFVFADEMQPMLKAHDRVSGREEILAVKQKAIDAKYKDRIGEGRENPFEAICKDENEIRNEFLEVNHDLEVAFKGYQQTAYRRINELLHYYLYTQWPDQFELTKVWAQMAWLQMLRNQKVMFEEKSRWCIRTDPSPEESLDSLQQFDDVACQYKSTLDLGGGQIISECSRTIVKLSIPGVDFNMKHDIEANRIISGAVMVGVSKRLAATKGPIGAEIEANAGVGVEFDNSGVTDIQAVAGVSVNAAGQTIVGIEGRVSVNSGPSVSGKGLLQGK